MIVSPAGSAQHRTRSLLSPVTMKPSCSVGAGDSRTKLTLKMGVGEGSIFSRRWDSPMGDSLPGQATLLRLQTPRHSPGIQADMQQTPPTPTGPPGAEKGTSVTSLSVQTPQLNDTLCLFA
ncbi:hypothetical protein E5288_WYG012334 [Bos mutus]|uniref:Uncharacterized protein n=1 Tax=Bos mutus TaxID=72004 RepID=A0A6B0RRD1_9CETA|nr:hypothetical protein [Bos mutus]